MKCQNCGNKTTELAPCGMSVCSVCCAECYQQEGFCADICGNGKNKHHGIEERNKYITWLYLSGQSKEDICKTVGLSLATINVYLCKSNALKQNKK